VLAAEQGPQAATRTPWRGQSRPQLLERLGPAALVELTVFIGFANLASRVNTAHGITSQGYSDACEIPLARRPERVPAWDPRHDRGPVRRPSQPDVHGRQPRLSETRCQALEDTASFVKILADADTRLMLGAHLIGPQASTLIQPLVQAMSLGNTVDEVAGGVLYVHPALTEVLEQALLQL
jgi:hypothetical protein